MHGVSLLLILELWLEWLRDEIPLATDEKERKHVYDLFERAVKDYLCKFIWKHLSKFQSTKIDEFLFTKS